MLPRPTAVALLLALHTPRAWAYAYAFSSSPIAMGRSAAISARPTTVCSATANSIGMVPRSSRAFMPQTALSTGLWRQRRGALAYGVVRMMSDSRKKIVFLGTPEVAARSLKRLIEASRADDSTFDLTAVVSNPPAKSGRKKQLQPSPVQALAEEEGIPVLTPTGLLKKYEDSAEFLEKMREMAPDLCITAAYGQFLPKSFLCIPKHGTLNIHPSLLPKFRGASPVPRALEEGVAVTGVSVLFTVFEMDAGPIAAQTEVPAPP
jgi:folate-dependent phosphoribosylglycinamide formyltransferase PurN